MKLKKLQLPQGVNPTLYAAQMKQGIDNAVKLQEALDKVEVVVQLERVQVTFTGIGLPVKILVAPDAQLPEVLEDILAAFIEGHNRTGRLRDEVSKGVVDWDGAMRFIQEQLPKVR